ncbi:MAG TPA: hypothetical protein PKD51_02435 [Saprospiraceae bacterium]|nr:hypothetical protein [Saprospiraceae bacterium]HMU02752.1 hypothetical protein [Saprospiraceae bacterium]
MTINDEMKIRELYKSKTDDELRSEFERISADPFGTFDFNNKDISHFNLKKVLKEVMDERFITVVNQVSPQNNSPYNINGIPGQNPSHQPNSTRSSEPNAGKIILGIILFIVGVGITMASEGQVITYGLILVGLVTMVQGFIGD